MLWLKDIEIEEFTSLLKEVRDLETRRGTNVRSYLQDKYEDLFLAESKRDRHSWYTNIRKSMVKGQDGIIQLKSETKKESSNSAI